ncbi:TadE/TadG family type IV pilus assembly protein [uncultured Brevundimonas sp.]|uniref:TadE/TadG family type IV pilus assembly protein n=1 Tax=uncultured Brevundimonas sp. TaxID=213418 RepID=UPI0025948EFF|nr:TadE/TadG family type IV pilus assembly protein [uncultured Brevundimonas sp.]
MTVLNALSGALARLSSVAALLRGDRRGNVAILFALALPTLVMVVLGGIDIQRVTTVRANLQDALDAATLAAARSPYVEDEDLTEVGLNVLKANMQGFPGVTIDDSAIQFKLENGEIVVANATVDVKTLVANIVLPPYGKILDDTLPVGAHSEVNRSTKDVEVALVLDITGSMSGSRIRDLKTAANDLVDIVVQDEARQAVTRTRIALVPYSMGVNAGDYAAAVRGEIRGRTNIDAADWGTGSTKSVSGVTKGSQTTVKANGHGFQNNDYVWLTGVSSSGSGSSLASRLNNKAYRVQRVDANNVRLQTWNGSSWVEYSTSGYTNYSSGGTLRKCLVSTCEVVATSPNHGLQTGEDIRIDDVRGLTVLNSDDRSATRLDKDTFVVNGLLPNTVGSQTYSSASTDYVQCLELGCQFYKFSNYYGSTRIQEVSDCVSERIGTGMYTEAAPGSAPVGLAYPSSDNRCLGSTILPLTYKKDELKSQINGYSAVGSTAGQIGVEWGWYMISPVFGAIFPSDNRPDPYDAQKRLKVVILMTDGEFNTPYCNGVVAGAVSGSGDVNQHIGCSQYTGANLQNQPVGQYSNPFARSVEMCKQMKAAGVIVYTVGFDINTGTGGAGVDTAKEVMQQCATNSDHVYLPENGASLKSAFGAIGRSISQLRITR